MLLTVIFLNKIIEGAYMKKIIIFFLVIICSFIHSEENLNGYNLVEKKGIKFYWRISDNYFDVKVSAKCKGWISVGIDPTVKMKDADIVIAYIKKGKVFAQDNYGIAPVYHKPDVELGGVDNVINLIGKEENGITEIAYSIPINSGDKYDKIIKTGKHRIILAFSNKDDFSSRHKVRTDVEIIIKL